MKKLMQKLAAAAFAAAALSAMAGNTTISADTTFTSEQKYTDGHVYVDADVTIGSGGLMNMANGTWGYHMYLPYTSGKDVTVTLDRGSGRGIQFYYPESNCPSSVRIGENGGKGHIVVASGSARLNKVHVRPNAVADASGYIDFLTLSGNSANNDYASGSFFVTNTTATARVVFDGGHIMPPYSTNPQTLFDIGPGSGVALESPNGSDIIVVLNHGDKRSNARLNAGSGAFATAGSCNLIVWNSGGDGFLHFCAGEDRATWGHSGDSVLRQNANAILDVDQGLPHGAGTGIIRFTSDSSGSKKYLDLNGHVSAVNGLVFDATSLASANNFVTNSSESAEGVLQFGVRNEDSTLTAGTFGGDCAVEKLGSGTLTVTKAVAPKLRVLGGTVRVAGAGVSFDDIVVSNATLVVDGVALSSAKVVCIDCGRISLVNGGSLPAGCAVRRTLLTSDYPSRWTGFNIVDYGYADPFAAGTTVDIVKTGTDTFTYFQAAPTIADVDVREGRLRFGGVADTGAYPWWRFTIRKSGMSLERTASGVTTNLHAGLGRWWVVTPALDGGSGGPNLIYGSSAAVGTAPADLAENQWTAAKPWIVASGAGSFAAGADWKAPNILGFPFQSNSYQFFYSLVFANQAPDPEDSSTWETIAFRLSSANAAKTKGGYLLSRPGNYPNGEPTAWTVEASSDGVNWTTMDTRDGVDLSDSLGYWMNGGRMFLFNANAASWSFAPTGMVKVASGATLDLTEIPDANISIAGLEVDVANGGGTITHFAPAANGTLALVGVSSSLLDANGQLDGSLALPLTIGSMGGAGNLATWSVTANGVEQKGATISASSAGGLKVSRPSPTTIVLR